MAERSLESYAPLGSTSLTLVSRRTNLRLEAGGLLRCAYIETRARQCSMVAVAYSKKSPILTHRGAEKCKSLRSTSTRALHIRVGRLLIPIDHQFHLGSESHEPSDFRYGIGNGKGHSSSSPRNSRRTGSKLSRSCCILLPVS